MYFFENKPFHRHIHRLGRFTRLSDLRVVSNVEISKASLNILWLRLKLKVLVSTLLEVLGM